MRLAIRSALSAIVFVLGFVLPAEAAITGVVLDSSGAPVAGVAVKAFADETPQETKARWLAGIASPEPLASATTSKDGEFRFDKIGKPTAWIVVNVPGRGLLARSVADGDDTVALVLTDATPRHLRIVAGGKPVKDAIVAVTPFASVRTTADGTADLAVAAGREVTVIHPAFVPSHKQLSERETTITLNSGATLRGRTVAADGRSPVAGASISIDGFPFVKSGDDGTFTIVHAPNSWTTLHAVKGTTIAEATRSSREGFTLRMQPAAIVSGLVRDSKTRKPVAGMVLGTPAVGTITGDDGRFTLAFLPGTQILTATHPKYDLAPGSGMLSVRAAGLAITLPVVLRPMVSGTVVDEERKPVAAAVVGAVLRGYSRAPRPDAVASSRTGQFAIRLSSSDSGDLEFRKDGYASTVVPFKRGESKDGIQVTLRRGVPLVVRVVDGDRAPVPGVTVAVSEPRLGTQYGPYGPVQPRQINCAGGECLTGADGSVKVQVAPGRYEIAVSGAGIVNRKLPLQIVDARSGAVVAVVERGVDVSGRVVYPDGTPVTIPGRIIVETSLTTQSGSDTMASDGTFVVHGVPRGKVKLRAESTERGGAFGIASPAKEITAPADNVVLTMQRGGQITGRAVDAASGQPLQNYSIGLVRSSGGGFSSTSNSVKSDDGTFTLENVTPGRFEVQASAPGFTRASATGVEVVEGQTTSGIELRLDRGATVRGRVTSSDGDPVSEVFVSVTGERIMSSSGAASQTDANGEYELSTVPAGERNVNFTKEGFVSTAKTVDATVGKETRLDVTLDSGREISGRVIDEAGDPVVSADINVEGASVRGVQSEGDGTFKIAGLANNRVRVVAHKAGYTTTRSDEIDPASGAGVVLTMRRGAVVNGHVSGVEGNDLAYVTISARGADSSGETLPDTSGNFTIPGMSDGRVTVTASLGKAQASSRTARKTIDVVNGIAPPVDLVLASGYTVSGHVRVAGGRSPGDLMVMFYNSEGTNASSPVGSDGTYSVSGLTSGDYRVMARAQYGPGMMYSGNYTVTGDGTFDIDTHSFSVHGHVTDTNGAPIPDATVLVRLIPAAPSGAGGTVIPPPTMQLPLSTDSSGRYVGETYGVGTLHIEVQKQQFQTATKDVEVSDSMPDVDFQLQSGTATVVRVVDGRDGSPLVANVAATTPENKAGGGSRATTRASDGVAELWLAPGHYDLYVYAPNYAQNHATLDVPAAGEMRIPMFQGGTVIVINRDPAASVILVAANDPSFRRGTSNGRFTNVMPGAYKLQLMQAGKKIAEKLVQVIDGQTVTVAFE